MPVLDFHPAGGLDLLIPDGIYSVGWTPPTAFDLLPSPLVAGPIPPSVPEPDLARLPVQAVHEACHTLAAYMLGGHVSALLVWRDGEGYCVHAFPTGPDGQLAAAVVAAVGVEINTLMRLDPSRCASDVESVRRHLDEYMILTLKAPPNPYDRAAALLRCPTFTTVSMRLASQIQLETVYRRPVIEFMLRRAGWAVEDHAG